MGLVLLFIVLAVAAATLSVVIEGFAWLLLVATVLFLVGVLAGGRRRHSTGA